MNGPQHYNAAEHYLSQATEKFHKAFESKDQIEADNLTTIATTFLALSASHSHLANVACMSDNLTEDAENMARWLEVTRETVYDDGRKFVNQEES